MIFVTGDMHGSIDIHKFNTKRFPKGKELLKEDCVLITGDFGAVWNGSKSDKFWLDWLNKKSWTTIFLDGNHEAFPLLNSYPIKEWKGGKVHVIRDSVYHLVRGEVYNLDGISLFVLGGAQSWDMDRRIEGVNWWPEELPSEEELLYARQQLDRIGWKVDLVGTHTMATSLAIKLRLRKEENSLNLFLDELETRLDYGLWFNGHFHIDEPLNESRILVYHDIYQVEKVNGRMKWERFSTEEPPAHVRRVKK